jgi:plasmid stabilization system protein ParE
MKLFWTPLAKFDLIEISRFIAEDNAVAARIWAGRLKQRAKDAAKNPFAGRVVPELEDPSIREVLLGSYRIIYRVKEKHVEIIRVFEGHRLIPIAKGTKY